MKKIIASAVMLCSFSSFADAQQEMTLICKLSGDQKSINLEGKHEHEKWMFSEDLTLALKFSEDWYAHQVAYSIEMRINKDKLVEEKELLEELPLMQRDIYWVSRYDLSVEHIYSSDFGDTKRAYGQCEIASKSDRIM